jgi:predicted nucleic acid-binding protein
MIVLDTNVVSAMMRSPPDSTVISLLDKRDPDSIWTTSITLFEIRQGIERLPDSRRRAELEAAAQRAFDRVFAGRVLEFDSEAAHSAAVLAADRARHGRPGDFRDTLIAGIVLSRHAEFATRNVRHFADLDVSVVDPWAA